MMTSTDLAVGNGPQKSVEACTQGPFGVGNIFMGLH